jgi:hypothetical protein
MELANLIIKHLSSQYKCRIDSSEEIVLYFDEGLTITIDIDIKWCRIHHHWNLQKAVDLKKYWGDDQKCLELIIEN